MPPRKKSTAKKSTAKSGEVIYPNPKCMLHIGLKALTADQAKKYLGWTVLSEGDTSEPLLKSAEGGVRCLMNEKVINRPLKLAWCKILMQDILRGRWSFNFENVILGTSGAILSGQHRLIALVLAAEAYHADPDAYPFWKDEPTIEISVAVGAQESDAVVNTLDTARPRSLADVVYRCDYFKSSTGRERSIKATTMQNAVRFLWERTGIKGMGVVPTHAEAIDYIEKHKLLVQCVNHMFVQNMDKSLSRYIPIGMSTGLCYLMGTSASDPDKYKNSSKPSQRILDTSRMEEAEEFWLLLSSEPEFQKLRDELDKLLLAEDVGSSMLESKIALIVKAWNEFIDNDRKITPKGFKLKFTTDDEGWKYLDEEPLIGGIDFGGSREDEVEEDEDDSEELEEDDVEDIEEEEEEEDIEEEEEGGSLEDEMSDEDAYEDAEEEEDTEEVGEDELSKGDAVKITSPDSEPWEGKVHMVEPLKVRANKGEPKAGKIVVVPEDAEVEIL